MRIESNYPSPVHGVSTLAPRNRAEGQASRQVNMRSDPVTKLTRRPSLKRGNKLLVTENPIVTHSYYRRERKIDVIVDTVTGETFGFVDDISKPVVGDISTYANTQNLFMETINDTTFVVNTDKTVELLPNTDVVQNVAHINVTAALGYGETIEVYIGAQSPYPASVTITIDNVENATTADAQRRTNQVASDIAAGLQGTITGLNAQSKGSAVAIWYDNNSQVQVTVSSGGGDDVKLFNHVTENVSGLPLYARVGTKILVQPDPSSNDGRYYLDAIALDGTTTPFTELVEVVWTESRSPTEPHAFNQATMPHTVRYDYLTDSFVIGEAELGWEERTKGDNDSVNVPKFVGRTIQALGQFQKRLVLISDNDVEMTVTDNLYNWWKQSAIDLLVTDPISISSNTPRIDILQHIVEHNRDLMIVAANGQFKIDGTQGVTPQTVAMPLTTTQDIQISVPPVTMGTEVFMPINYGDSTGVIEYTGKRDESDVAASVTSHVIDYMKGDADILVGSPNLDMLAMTTDKSDDNVIFIYEQFVSNTKKLQQSWSEWVLPVGNEVLHMSFIGSTLHLIVREGSTIVSKSFDMYSRVGISTEEVFLDDFIALESTGTSLELPDGYPVDNIIVVGGQNTKYPLFQIEYTREGNTITFDKPVSSETCTMYVGSRFWSGYSPTRPFRFDEKGIAITTDRIRVNRFVLDVVRTDRVTMSIDSDYNQIPDQTKLTRITNSLTNKVGEVNLYTGTFQFSFGQNAEHARATFWTDGWLGMTIAGISWKGQYHKSSGRF